MFKIIILNKRIYEQYWYQNYGKKYIKKFKSGFEKYIEYINSGKTIRCGYTSFMNTNCKELFGCSYPTLCKHSRTLQELGAIKREFPEDKRSDEIKHYKSIMKIRGNIRRLLNKINDNDLKKIYNIVEKYDGEETKMLPR